MTRFRLALVAVLAIAISCVSVPSVLAAPAAPAYVALGDSRAAAPTLTSAQHPDGCGRTRDAYPTHLASQLRMSYTSVACVNATTADVTTRRQTTSFGARPVQIDALSWSTRLVTLSIGGNDLRWWSIVSSCFTPRFGQDARCRQDRVMADRMTSALTAVAPKIGATLSLIRARAPLARVVLVGHGGYYGRTGCPGQANISNADAAYLQTFFKRFDAILRTAAVTRSMTFVDVASAAVGHDACAGAARWFEGNASQSQTQPRHPTPLGSRAIANLIVRAL
ncbi:MULTISPECIES: SGNH/GDSL hydrolase family protein [unclassified Gordonia (in: high G+C Gram-positive bacteria)]|uniref:SGNH/GDSL hydrolase family protein n=1 Tax=unclassified Gordonia (in: high G+C Gram-positive bacteria) TaxID=2657482 RepID=UPI001965A65C|nr:MULTISPECIES: SGNH/GDSL hydrolase family protein [unclassified Gordonia (in: high G+C Gram-positive bacteria)]MBN0975435.1 SGNH/GDSL hydrolase family protein [Gordonia sp. BP-119]MBN0985582.1 SGNH/GDSL hydrolase family protein [Gordonia sp. BP-94]